jgi:putative transcriptional regulator
VRGASTTTVASLVPLLVIEPAAVAELNEQFVVGQLRAQPLQILPRLRLRHDVRRELDQDSAELAGLVRRLERLAEEANELAAHLPRHALDAVAGVGLEPVAEALGYLLQLDRVAGHRRERLEVEDEAVRRPGGPFLDVLAGRQPVEGRVDLDGVEVLRVVGQLVAAGAQPARVEVLLERLVGERAGADADGRHAADGTNGGMDSLKGRLLVASPALVDPNFRRSVVLIAEHTEEGGAMGVVLSRPSETQVAEAAPVLEALVEPGAVVHVGGPVEPGAVLVMAEFEDPDDAATVVFDGVGFMPADSEPEDVALATRRARIFAGYAGWSPGQLEAELEEESWLVLDPEPSDVFAEDAAELWSAVLARQGGTLSLLARLPADPSVN